MAPDINESKNTTSSPELKIPSEESEIVEFYNGANVLVTGGTGFVGKVLVEKLLRSCPGIANLYIIVRPKKGKPATARFKENFDEAVYDRLKQERPDFMDKVVMIESDISEEDFSQVQEISEMLKNTNIVFHAAATVRFDEKLSLAVKTNVCITKRMLLWAKGLSNLKAFVYVSTAFSNCHHKVIDEIHYKTTIDPDVFISLANTLDDDQLEAMKPILFNKYQNNYIITKAIAEAAVLKYGQDVPVGIVRPSVVLATAEEPLKAWINNLYGSTGIIAGAGLGFIRTIHCIPEYIADLIPADYVVATVVAAAWDIAHRKSLIKQNEVAKLLDEEKVPVYNSVTSPQNPTTWHDFIELNMIYGHDVPSVNSIWYFMLFFTRYTFVYRMNLFLLHIMPAFIADTIARLIGRKPILMDTYKKIHKFTGLMEHFSMNEWVFRNENVKKMWRKLNSVDRKLFNFNVENIVWTDYYYHYVRGVRQYVVNDPMETLDVAIVKHRRLRIAHYTLMTLLTLLVAWLTLSFLTVLWSRCSRVY